MTVDLDLTQRHCESLRPGTKTLPLPQVDLYLSKIEGWSPNETYRKIAREFQFKNYHQVLAFVNAVAWIAHQQDHHPHIRFGYNTCTIEYTTHAIIGTGLSLNDLICAAKINTLLDKA